MAKNPIAVEMNIGSGRIIQIDVPFGIADYFGVAPAPAAAESERKTKEAYTRTIRSRDDLTSTVVKTVTVPRSEYYSSGTVRGGRGSGKLIKLPTEVLMQPGKVDSPFRIVSMRIPQVASNFVISQWINTKFTKHKPSYYISSSGVMYPVNVATQADPNPGNGGPAPAP
jgi:hypothetical protein